MATQNYEVTVNPNAITLDLTTQNNILTVQTVDYIMSLSRTGGQGAQGYSAYEIAVQNGYTGTAQEFSDELASIAEKSALAVASAAAAATSATSASNSATASATSASNSSTSAGAASASANAAAQSAVTAAAQSNNSAQSAINAAASALEASNWADASEDSAIDSELSAADAAASEDAAASSEANALLYRNEAQASASSALASSTNANSQALAASLSAASAATSATNADNSEDNAASSATSALNSATSANTSANQAAISATTATTQATSATNSATAAAASQADALVSKDSASASASTATTKASEASNSAATASTKATEASTSAAQAVLSATSASTSASTATLKAAEAAQSAADAAAAQAAAEASLASFRSTYLGELNADPTLDGNGDPVMIGAEYFNSVENKLKVYTSTGWQFYDATAQTASQNAALSASQAASSAATSQSYATTAINKAAEAASSADAADASADAALASENAAESSEINASASENYALNYKNAAATSADLASSYASASGVSATNAATSATTATTQATNSANSATASATSATNSANSALASANSATNAANSAASAATSATNAGISEANADTSEANALASANTATTKAAEASTSANDAATSATNSAASATSSALSEGIATTAAATATTKASEASVSATSASGSAATATTKAAEATSAASSATTSAANAATSATNAANSASSANTSSASASTSATLAGNSANAAALSETNAATSASAANTYASNAATSASSADTSESNAEIYADNALASSIAAANTVTTVTGYANTASTKADEASASATSAANSATSATASANTASTQATNASNSATAASTSASNASTSATTASTQASNAAASASSASTSASAANISAINADTSATSAANSATAAGSAKVAAEAARDQALAAFDNFDDKYLGEKASNPTLDNDGNTLVVGALYFNTTLQGMRVYTGTAWVAAYMSGDGYLLGSNNLSDLTNVVTARTNLGLGTSALANGYNLDGLTDVTITSATNGQILEYESATSTWKNKTINALPTQATHNGQFLTTDGTNASWATVDALPPQATHADKFLRTDGTAAYWATVNLPTSAYTRTSFTATAGQTIFNVTYPLGSIQVYVNGVLLKTSDYTATNETSFTLTVPASAGAAVDALVYNVYGVGQVLAENIIGTVDIESGGTGATTAAGARTNLGLGTAATTDSTAYATAAQGALIDNIVSATKEPIGFVNKNDSSISFNSTTRVFTISPVGGSFEVWCKGVKNVVSTAQTITLPNTTALYYIYYSSLGVLSYKTTYFTWDTDTPVSYVYWNATTGQAAYFADERHGTTLDWATHEYLHRTRGAVIASGFAANGYTLSGTGDLNSDAQISIESGTFFDEDLEINVVSTATPTQNTWTQNLLFPAKIPVLRLSGASEWILDTATDYPLKQGTARPQYNYYSGGVWLTADVLNNDYTCSWIIATNNLNHPVMAIISQSNLTTLSNAQSAKFEELILTNFPSLEFRPLYKLIFQGNDGYENTPNARLREIYDLRAVQSAGVSAAAVNDHSNLSGLSDDDHPQYLHVDNIRTVSAAVKASLLPSQTTNANKFLNTNGTETSWSLVDVGNVTGTLPIANGGTGATTASGALTNLGAYPATNPSNYITTAGARSAISVTGAGSYDSGTGVINIVGGVTSFNTRTGAISLTSGDVTGALGFTPYNSTNPNGYISGITSGNVTTALGYTPENVANKGNANGYASLDGSGLVPASQLPSYVDDVLEYTNLASFPGAGTTGKIYVALDTNKTYRWSGTTYIYITSGAVDSVAGKTGVVTLNNSDVGLGSVENKSSATIRSEITSSNVTTALGFTPYNATNPSGYITSSALSSYLPLSGGTLTGPVLTTTDSSSWGVYSRTSGYENYSGIWFSTNVGELLLRKADGSLSTRIAADGSFAFINNNNILHAGNYNSYALPLSGGTVSGLVRINNQLRVGQNTNGTAYIDAYDGYAWFGRDSNSTGIRIDGSGNVNITGALTQGGSQVLHAGNSQDYKARSLNAVRTTNSNFNALSTAVDTFTAGTNYIPSGGAYNQPADGDHHYLSWGGIEGAAVWGAQIDVNFYDDRVWFRRQSGANWQAWRQFIHDGNYNSYAPTLTGNGASGTWNINITGNAATATSATDSSKLPLTGGSLSGNLSITPVPSSWAEGLAFQMPSTSTWGGLRWRRNRAGDDGNWYVGFTALDSSDDLVFGANNGGAQIDNILRLTKAGVVTNNGNQILHAGNYNSYALPLTAGGIQYLRFDTASTEHITFQNYTSGGRIQLGFQQNDTDGLHHRAYFRAYKSAASSIAGVFDIIIRSADAGTTADVFKLEAGQAPRWGGNTMLTASNYSSYSLPLSGGTVTGTATFSRTDDNAISVGTIRGRAVGSQSGDFLHIYERVHIGSPAGWGSRSAPSYGLSTYGGCALATDTGSVTIGGNTALHAGNYNSYALPLTGGTVSGRTTFSDGIRIGPTPGDPNAYIISRTIPAGDPNVGNEITELLLFHSNDNATGGAGPDYITLRAPAIRFQTYDAPAVADPDASGGWNNRLTISPTGTVNSVGALTQGGNQVLHADNYTSYTLPIGGGWYGSGLPGSRWSGLAVNGGEIAFGNGLPNANQMGILVDGCYVAGENNGFWSMGGDNSWGSRRGMYWDGSSLNFTTNNPIASFSNLTIVGSSDKYLYINPGNGYEAMVRYNGGSGSGWYVGKRMANVLVGNESFHFYSEAATATVAGVDTGGNVFASGSFRAPIFYDSPDTGYYVDPAGTSRIGGIQISPADGGTTGNAIRFYGNSGDGAGAYDHAAIIDRLWGAADQSELLIFKGNDPDTSTIHDRVRIAATGRIVFHSVNGYTAVDAYISGNTGNINGSGYFNGNDLIVTGNVTAYSDIKLKENIQVIDNALSKVKLIQGVTYTRNDLDDKTRRYSGVIAQQVEKVLPEVVEQDEDGLRNVAYGNMVGLLVEAIKEQDTEVTTLRSQLQQQQSELDELKSLVKSLLANR